MGVSLIILQDDVVKGHRYIVRHHKCLLSQTYAVVVTRNGIYIICIQSALRDHVIIISKSSFQCE